MDFPESALQSFLIRLWLEEAADDAGRARWRGHVTHIPSGRRQYVHNLAEIVAFLRPYIADMERLQPPTGG